MEYKYYPFVNNDFETLSNELNQELHNQFGQAQEKYQQYNLLNNIHDVIICYDFQTPIGCVSMKYYDKSTYEIKRMYLRKDYRGKGISKQLMIEIEKIAKDKGIYRLILETGEKLVPAMNLYISCGYKIIENYGQYKDMTESICMEKIL